MISNLNAILQYFRTIHGLHHMDTGFIWDEDKYKEVQLKHNVKFYEVVAAFDDPHGYEIDDPAGHEDRRMRIGITAGGRVLAIVYSEEDLPIYRLITAFDAERRWINEYHKGSGI